MISCRISSLTLKNIQKEKLNRISWTNESKSTKSIKSRKGVYLIFLLVMLLKKKTKKKTINNDCSFGSKIIEQL